MINNKGHVAYGFTMGTIISSLLTIILPTDIAFIAICLFTIIGMYVYEKNSNYMKINKKLTNAARRSISSFFNEDHQTLVNIGFYEINVYSILDKHQIDIKCARPGILIGKSGVQIDDLRTFILEHPEFKENEINMENLNIHITDYNPFKNIK